MTTTTVKDILIESLNRSNLVPRKRSAPADMLESAYRLFKGIIQKYNFANFISYTRKEIDVVPEDAVVGLDGSDISSIANVSYKNNENSYTEMRFVSYEQFYGEPDDYVYSWKYNDEGQIEIYFKKNFVASHKEVKVICNSNVQHNLDDELHIPEIYIELFTAALTHKLAITYPRTDPAQVTLLKGELDEIEKQVKALVSSNKILTRDTATISNFSSFISGDFIFGR